jgi:hypothetical protein
VNDLIAKAAQERAALLKQAETINARIAEIDTFIRMANAYSAEMTKQGKEVAPKTFKAAVMEVATEMLSGGGYRQTREIADELKRRGVTIKGKDEVVRVSQVLITEPEKFTSKRGKGWRLAPPPKVKGSGASTPNPLSSAMSRPRQPKLAVQPSM